VGWHRDEESRIHVVQAKAKAAGTAATAGSGAVPATPSSSRRKSITASMSMSMSMSANANADAGSSGSSSSSRVVVDDMSVPLKELVLDYLTHHGYARTAQAFRAQNERGAEHGMTGILSTSTSTSSGRSERYASGDSMDMDEAHREYHTGADDGLSPDERDMRSRQKIIEAILAGDVDSAMADTKRQFPAVLDAQKGLVHFKLKCRAFVELLLEAAAALRRVKLEAAMATAAGASSVKTVSSESTVKSHSDSDWEGVADADDMDVDMTDDAFDSPQPTPPPAPPIDLKQKQREVFIDADADAPPSKSATHAHAQMVLNRALGYGQVLHAEYARDTRPVVQSVFKSTFSLVAYEDPLGGSAPPEIVKFAGQSARAELAEELNRAILESQGRATKSTLESVYRQAMGTVIELGLFGVGTAAYADAEKEFLRADL